MGGRKFLALLACPEFDENNKHWKKLINLMSEQEDISNQMKLLSEETEVDKDEFSSSDVILDAVLETSKKRKAEEIETKNQSNQNVPNEIYVESSLASSTSSTTTSPYKKSKDKRV